MPRRTKPPPASVADVGVKLVLVGVRPPSLPLLEEMALKGGNGLFSASDGTPSSYSIAVVGKAATAEPAVGCDAGN